MNILNSSMNFLPLQICLVAKNNGRILLEIDNSKLAADDFKMKWEIIWIFMNLMFS